MGAAEAVVDVGAVPAGDAVGAAVVDAACDDPLGVGAAGVFKPAVGSSRLPQAMSRRLVEASTASGKSRFMVLSS